ncbi:MAG: hypothetical protein ACFFB2_07150 [Promethearchaeota archaeon]
MQEIANFRTEYSSHQFSATIYFKERGLVIDIVGPNDHLGGVGIGVPYIRKNGDESANYHCISFPSHRDGELAGSIARIIAKITRLHTLVLFGIHFPDLTRSQLDELIHFFKQWADEIGKNLLPKLL